MAVRPQARGLGAALALLAAGLAGPWAVRGRADEPAAPPSVAPAAPAAPTVQELQEIVVVAPEPRYVAPTTRDRIGRIWAPVLINGQGPYRLVLDTGASHSGVTMAVATELGATIRPEAARLRGTTGSAVASTVRVKTFEVGELASDDATLVIVPDAFGGAQGVLGGEALYDMRVVIEFRHDRISIMRSHRQPPQGGYSVVPFRYGLRSGMRANVLVGRVKATALIDTGAQATVGNLALRAALARSAPKPDDYDSAIEGVTQDIQRAASAVIPGIVAGDLIVRNATILFSDLDIFGHWKLDTTPTLLIGMDVLGVLDTLIIDYKRRELQIRTR